MLLTSVVDHVDEEVCDKKSVDLLFTFEQVHTKSLLDIYNLFAKREELAILFQVSRTPKVARFF